MLDCLQIGDGAAKGLAFLDKGAGPLETRLGAGDGHVADEQSLLRQLCHQVREAPTFLSQKS